MQCWPWQAQDASRTAIASDEPTASDEQTIPAADPEQEVLDAWDASQEALSAAYDPPDPDYPDLLATRAGESLNKQRTQLRDLQDRGVSWVTTKETSREVTSLDGDTAVVQACIHEDAREVDTQTRKELAADDPVFHLEQTMELIDGAWKVVRTETVDKPCTVD